MTQIILEENILLCSNYLELQNIAVILANMKYLPVEHAANLMKYNCGVLCACEDTFQDH